MDVMPNFPSDFKMFSEIVERVEYLDGCEVTYGYTDIHPSRKQYDVLGAYPRKWVEVRYLTLDEIQSARARTQRNTNITRKYIDKMPPQEPTKLVRKCARCERPVKPQYTHCYRCNNYLQVKARIAG